MNDDNFVTLFGSSAGAEFEGNNELEAARAHGFLMLNDVKSVSGDEAQLKEREQQEVLFMLIASL
jgi:hypothetical protein